MKRKVLLASLCLVACSKSPSAPNGDFSEHQDSASSGGAAAGEESAELNLPYPLYELGGFRPKALTVHAGTLYWAQSSAENGREIMKAPADGSASPEKIGSSTGKDLFSTMISASSRYVAWPSFPNLIVHSLETGENQEFETGFQSNSGPTLIIDDRWVVAAEANCMNLFFIDLATGTSRGLAVSEEFYGGNTGLAELNGDAFCASDLEVLRLRLPEEEVETVWKGEDIQSLLRDIQRYGDVLVFAQTIIDLPKRQVFFSLDESFQSEKLFELEDASFVFSPDSKRNGIYVKRWSQNAPARFVSSKSGESYAFPGETRLAGNFVGDEDYLYWVTEEFGESSPYNRIYRQKK